MDRWHPTSQSKKFDPNGAYIRRWLPEQFIHEPALMSDEVQQQVGCVIGRDCPVPIVGRLESGHWQCMGRLRRTHRGQSYVDYKLVKMIVERYFQGKARITGFLIAS